MTENQMSPASPASTLHELDSFASTVSDAKDEVTGTIALKELKELMPLFQDMAKDIERKASNESAVLIKNEKAEIANINAKYATARNAMKDKYSSQFQKIKGLIEKINQIGGV